jgi:hypothetical protein
MNLQCHSPTRKALVPLGSLIVMMSLTCAAGCSKPIAKVRGTVTLDNAPLKQGEIHFVGEDGKSRSSVISEKGAYEIVDAPVGRVKVGVVSFQLVGEGGRFDTGLKILKTPPTPKSNIPEKYNDPAQSGLSYEVAAREQTINVELKK